MSAEDVPISIEQGATWGLGFTWHEEGPVVDGEVTAGDPHDLTGWTARMQIRKKVGEPVLAEATTENGKITLGGATGRVDIKLSPADTDAIGEKTAKYDLELEDPAGDVYRLLEGAVTISPNITRDV
jgi:hypothetical protein